VGGNETTMNMLAMGMRKLATQPTLQTELRGSPQNVSRFVEEMLRLEGSVQALLRVATRDVEIDGVVIPSGANVVLCSGSANRDFINHAATEGDGDFGIDSKFGISGSLNLDLTYNTDFAHAPRASRTHIAFATLLDRLENIELAIPAADIEQCAPFHQAIARLPMRFEPPLDRRN
jgi:hypothetical protein